MHYRNPKPTVDIIIETQQGVVLIRRATPPLGWALPGGFVEEGESLAAAAVREAFEETSLIIRLIEQFFSYSDPSRDPRQHTISTVFIAAAEGDPIAGDDASYAQTFSLKKLPEPLAFDHSTILKDYILFKQQGCRPPPTR